MLCFIEGKKYEGFEPEEDVKKVRPAESLNLALVRPEGRATAPE
jgi:hypothetical protein